MFDAWKAGGFGMFPTLLWGVLLLAASIRYAMNPERRFIPLIVSLGVLTTAAGVLGFVTGFITSVNAMAAEGATRPILTLLGVGEAAHCIALAIGLVVLASMATSAGELRLSMRKEAATAS